jgi:hypothetical protein
MKGLTLDIYKRGGQSFSGGGISQWNDTVTLVAVQDADGVLSPVPSDMQVFEEDDIRAPGVVLVTKRFSFGEHKFVAPIEPGEGAGPMMGGCYVGSSDSRFTTLAGVRAALPLHDRFEKSVAAAD